METRVLVTLGKVAGLAGIAMGVVILVFRGVLEKDFLPDRGLSPGQAFAIVLSMMIMTFGIAAIGIVAWLVARAVTPTRPVSQVSSSHLRELPA
ncbi:hypothetical protein SAMN03159496_03450 [Rhizobium sp. NFR07]|nr:hypothetical protein SAMN03159496_03450 [Rhizobium sp. NFR07]